MTLLAEQLIRHIHAAQGQVVIALNGGSTAVAELLQVPGGSRTLLEAVMPYAERALTAWLGSRPDQFCSSRTARAMAIAAFDRALGYGAAEEHAAGVSCTAGLATDRPKLGPHRAHVAVQTLDQTRHWSLELEKGARTRQEEEHVVGLMVLNAVAEACGVGERLELPLLEHEQVAMEHISAPRPWQDLFLGRIEALDVTANRESPSPTPPRVVLAGAFNPLHAGHRRMAQIAQEMVGFPAAMEISIKNVDKPALDYLEIDCRLRQFAPEQSVWLTRAAAFEEKSRLFAGATFVVGVDTLQRIADPRYYGNDPTVMMQAIQRIIARDCRFLVFGRALESGFVCLSDLALPDMLRHVCSEIPVETFREDVSSTELRREAI